MENLLILVNIILAVILIIDLLKYLLVKKFIVQSVVHIKYKK